LPEATNPRSEATKPSLRIYGGKGSACREWSEAGDAFIMTSRTEGLPLALLEAMAHGLPCIATEVGGIPELLRDECGLLINVNDPHSTSQAMLAVITVTGCTTAQRGPQEWDGLVRMPGTRLNAVFVKPDAKVLGFLNISSSQTGSLVRMEQYEMAALAIAEVVTADATALTGCDVAAAGLVEAACARPYVTDLGKRAYRRPLTAAELDGLMALLARNADTVDYKTRLAMVIRAILLSLADDTRELVRPRETLVRCTSITRVGV
jgi:hypothetical protein